MAEAGGSVTEIFKKFATKANGAEATSRDMTRWCKDAKVFGKNCTSNHMDICFAKSKEKGKPNLKAGELDAFLGHMAEMYAKDAKCSKDEAVAKLSAKLATCSGPKMHGTTGISKVGGVEKLTDTKQYTGAHKERFGGDGKGKGIDGRSDRADNTGYVGNYKGSGTFDKK